MPQRFLRPEIRTSARWNSIPFGAQGLYIGLMTLVDDFGRYDGRPALLHGEIFSLRNDVKAQQTAAWLKQLDVVDLIQLYSVEGKEYLQMSRWKERARSENSKFPDPPLRNPAESCGILPPSSSSSPLVISHKSSTNGTNGSSDLSDDDWLDSLSKDSTYQGIDVKREHGKMARWCEVKNKKPTRRRFINWLNNAERPIAATFSSEKETRLDREMREARERVQKQNEQRRKGSQDHATM